MESTQVIPLKQRKASRRGRETTFDDWSEITAFIAHEIHASGRTFNDIAKDASVCHQTVSKMASGETFTPHLRTAVSIIIALGYEVVAR
jgi:hypothetical protein